MQFVEQSIRKACATDLHVIECSDCMVKENRSKLLLGDILFGERFVQKGSTASGKKLIRRL
jgi:hypothetical protein